MLCVYGSPLYQWDKNRQLLIDSADLGSEFVVHCCYTDDSNALVVEPIVEGDTVLVNIPNILLQRHGYLRVYVVVEGDTIYDETLYVMARPKPDDYVYTETEVLSYESLDKRITELEKSGVSDEQIAEAVIAYLEKNPIQSGSTAKIGYVTLFAELWQCDDGLYSQIVEIEGVTNNTQVDLTPSAEQLDAFHSKDLTFTTKNANGVVTVYAIGQKPQNDYTIQVTLTEVER